MEFFRSRRYRAFIKYKHHIAIASDITNTSAPGVRFTCVVSILHRWILANCRAPAKTILVVLIFAFWNKGRDWNDQKSCVPYYCPTLCEIYRVSTRNLPQTPQVFSQWTTNNVLEHHPISFHILQVYLSAVSEQPDYDWKILQNSACYIG